MGGRAPEEGQRYPGGPREIGLPGDRQGRLAARERLPHADPEDQADRHRRFVRGGGRRMVRAEEGGDLARVLREGGTPAFGPSGTAPRRIVATVGAFLLLLPVPARACVCVEL